ncbi:MAG: hypothetical protein ACPL7O_00985 [Armatimonadota bacterium]
MLGGEPGRLDLSAGLTYTAWNNVSSIWDLDRESMPSARFTHDSAYALLESTRWIAVGQGEWILSFGSGTRDYYKGNSDAAQLWVDMHSDSVTQTEYVPKVSNTRISVNWFGISRSLPVRSGKMDGDLTVTLRKLVVDSYRSGSLVGRVSGDEFTGMMRTTSSEMLLGNADGQGWSLDAELSFRIGRRWIGRAVAEGLAGCISWDGLLTQDAYIMSPRVFVDPDGFLHDCGGATGMTWSTDLNARLSPHYRIDLMESASPHTLLGVYYHGDTRLLASVGLAWPQRNGWIAYTRCYPSQKRIELGALGKGWEFTVSGDDWLTASPRHGEVSLALSPLRF